MKARKEVIVSDEMKAVLDTPAKTLREAMLTELLKRSLNKHDEQKTVTPAVLRQRTIALHVRLARELIGRGASAHVAKKWKEPLQCVYTYCKRHRNFADVWIARVFDHTGCNPEDRIAAVTRELENLKLTIPLVRK